MGSGPFLQPLHCSWRADLRGGRSAVDVGRADGVCRLPLVEPFFCVDQSGRTAFRRKNFYLLSPACEIDVSTIAIRLRYEERKDPTLSFGPLRRRGNWSALRNSVFTSSGGRHRLGTSGYGSSGCHASRCRRGRDIAPLEYAVDRSFADGRLADSFTVMYSAKLPAILHYPLSSTAKVADSARQFFLVMQGFRVSMGPFLRGKKQVSDRLADR